MSNNPIVVSDSTEMNEMQRIVYKRLADELQAARLVALQDRRKQEKEAESKVEQNEAANALGEWRKESDKDATYNAQTLPATLVLNMLRLSNFWGKIIKHELNTEVTFPAQVREFLVGGAQALTFKAQNGLNRLIFGDGPLALPEVSHYVSLGNDGKLKIDPVFEQPSPQQIDAGETDLTNDQKKLNELFNQACIDWLSGEGYDFESNASPNLGCFVKRDAPEAGTRLKAEEFASRAKDPIKGLDAYIRVSCGVQSKMNVQSEPGRVESGPRPT